MYGMLIIEPIVILLLLYLNISPYFEFKEMVDQIYHKLFVRSEQ